MRITRGPVIGALATCLALSSTLTGSVAFGAPESRSDADRTTKTQFGLGAGAYGTRVMGGDLPAQSGRTAFSVIGCTKLAGKVNTNRLVEVDLNGVNVAGVRTRTSTTRQARTPNGVAVSARARTTVASVGLGSGLNALRLRGLTLTTRAFHDDRGFRTERDLSIEGITLGGLPVPGALNPDPGQVLIVPGVARITFLTGSQRAGKNGAQVFARGLRVRLFATQSTVTVGSAQSRITNGVPAGILGGYGRAANVRLLDNAIVSGKIANQPLPCEGTNNEWRVNDTAGIDLPGVLDIGAASGSAQGNQRDARNGYGKTRGNIARVELGDRLRDRLVIGVIQAQANVTKRDGRITKSADGTEVGFIRFGGEGQEVPGAGETLELPGLEITTRRITRTENSIRVVAVRVRVLEQSELPSTIDLGIAFTRIKPS